MVRALGRVAPAFEAPKKAPVKRPRMLQMNEVFHLVEIFGGQSEMAAAINETRQNVHNMIVRNRIPQALWPKISRAVSRMNKSDRAAVEKLFPVVESVIRFEAQS